MCKSFTTRVELILLQLDKVTYFYCSADRHEGLWISEKKKRKLGFISTLRNCIYYQVKPSIKDRLIPFLQ